MRGRLADQLLIFFFFRRHAELLFEILLRDPFETGLGDHEWLGICLRIVDRDGHFQEVMTYARESFLDAQA